MTNFLLFLELSLGWTARLVVKGRCQLRHSENVRQTAAAGMESREFGYGALPCESEMGIGSGCV